MADREHELRKGVCDAYSRAATCPSNSHPFPIGRRFAESLGYSPALLDRLPAAALDAFSGVSNVALWAPIEPGARVLDLGCGAGLDLLIAARRLGPRGYAVGIDFSEAMLHRARRALFEAGATNSQVVRSEAEQLPLADRSIDIALANGVFNLNPRRSTLFRELARVVRPGGTVCGAELILQAALPPDIRQSEADWFA